MELSTSKVICGIISEQKRWASLIEKFLGISPSLLEAIHETHIHGKLCYVAFGTTSPFTAILVENFARFNVNFAFRLGTCGGISPDLKVGDIVLVDSAIRGEGTSKCYIEESFPAVASYELLNMVAKKMKNKGLPFKVGKAWTTDGRFVERDEDILRFSKVGVLCVDMETSAFYVVSDLKNIKALSINIVTDMPINDLGRDIKGIVEPQIQGNITLLAKEVIKLLMEVIKDL